MDNIKRYMNACSQPQSNYAIQNFVDGSQLTPARRFRQSVIELEIAYSGKADSEYDIAVLNLRIKKLKKKLYNTRDNPDRSELLNLKISRQYRRLEAFNRTMLGREREILQHEQNLAACEIELGFNNDTTEDEVYELLQNAEAEYYLVKLATDTAAHIIANNGGPSQGVSIALQQMPACDISRFKDMLNGVLHSVSNTLYTPALHGGESPSALETLGRQIAEATTPITQVTTGKT